MATMGRREMNKDRDVNDVGFLIGRSVPASSLNVISSVVVHPLISTDQDHPYLGAPIMGDDFITATGIKAPTFAQQ
jgi:hypothetical protein